ncbi:MAG: ABC transporter permease [Pyrinomonadaceae bacterium MAG19_C2-C3]|nr:ABC transporter permease [Pyrinomonadaceae bacterium MAG19_C2-C3]
MPSSLPENASSLKSTFTVEDTASPGVVSSKPADSATAIILPDEPVVVIEARRSWSALDLRELWAYRELLYFLTVRDIKVRYKQTALGAAWAIIQPLFTMLVFTLFFGRLAGIDTGGVPYPLFAFAGLLAWTFFSNAVTNSGNSLVTDARLISKVYFPRMIIPGAAVAAGWVDLGIAFLFFLGLLLCYGVSLTWKLLLLAPLLALVSLLALGIGMLLAALNIKYRDVRYALPFIIQLWLFASPVIYPSSLVSPEWRWALMLNPMTGIIENLRAALFVQSEFNLPSLLASVLVTLVALIFGAYYFKRMEREFADIV